jgi:DNA mismatch repair ATPase MutS
MDLSTQGIGLSEQPVRGDEEATTRSGSNLIPEHPINDPKHWRRRAKEARALAEQIADPEAKRTMLKNADDYERLAQRKVAIRSGEVWASWP